MSDPFNRSAYLPLKSAVDALAGICDGAEQRDDRGFDGSDTRAGHLYAFLPLDAWPLSAFHRAWRWATKYQRQLGAMQIDCAELPEPPLYEGEDRQIALHPDGTGFLVVFPYDGDLISAFREIPGSELHKGMISDRLFFRYRTVKAVAGAGEALLAFASSHGFQLGPGVQERAAQCDQSPDDAVAVDQHEYRVELEPGTSTSFALYFPRVASLNEEVRRIPGRTYSYQGTFHWVIPGTAPAAEALLGFLERHPQFAVPAEITEHLRGLLTYV